MKKSEWATFIAGGILILLTACSGGKPATLSFKGTWRTTDENSLISRISQATFQVTCDGTKFKIVRRTEDQGFLMKQTQIYDGKWIHTKSFTQIGEDKVESGVESIPPEPGQLARLKFWEKPSGILDAKKPGETIAGRKTWLHLMTDRRPAGKLKGKAWIDAETGLLLKQVFSVYSPHSESEIRNVSNECQKIDYGAVNPAEFAKPS